MRHASIDCLELHPDLTWIYVADLKKSIVLTKVTLSICSAAVSGKPPALSQNKNEIPTRLTRF